MSLRRSRSHIQGYSNIDFRSKRDINSLKLYQPWKVPKDFGTMGYSGYDFTLDMKNKTFSVSKNISKLKDLNANVPDPKFYNTTQFYNDNKIKVNVNQDFEVERIAELDESRIGKEIFTGKNL